MNKMMLVISLLVSTMYVLAGCAIPTRQVRVIKSDTEIRVLRLTIEDGDVMTCDNNTCKVATK